MRAATVLREIRQERKNQMKECLDIPNMTPDRFNQLLLIDPPFNLDIVSLMEMWRLKYKQKQRKMDAPLEEVKNQWILAGKDPEERKNRRNAFQSLLHNRILLTHLENGEGMTVSQFMQRNKIEEIKNIISRTENQTTFTRKTYQVKCRSLWKFVLKHIYGSIPKCSKRCKPLKKGIRPLELSEAYSIFDEMEKKALRSSVAMRDLLILRILMYAGEGIGIKNILSLESENINFNESCVVLKGKQIKCSIAFMRLLKSYLGRKKGRVFEQNNKSVLQDHINKRLQRLSSQFDIENITPRSIQRSLSCILKSNGILS